MHRRTSHGALTALQKLFGQKLAKFQIVLHCMWHNDAFESFIDETAAEADDAGSIGGNYQHQP